jgi:CBS domain-containing protein
MKLREIMTDKVETIGPNESLKDAARKMKERHVGMLPVVEGDRLLGAVTDRDLVVRGLADGGEGKSVRDVMTQGPVTARAEDDTDSAMRTVCDKRVGRLMIVDGAGRLAGLVSATDIAVACKGQPGVDEMISSLGAEHRPSGRHVVEAR